MWKLFSSLSKAPADSIPYSTIYGAREKLYFAHINVYFNFGI